MEYEDGDNEVMPLQQARALLLAESAEAPATCKLPVQKQRIFATDTHPNEPSASERSQIG